MAATRTSVHLIGGFVVALLGHAGAAAAFPFVDPTNADNLPTGAPIGTDLPAADAAGLGNQLRLVNPMARATPGGWTIIPRLTIQEELTDNAYEVTSPRRPDAVTIVAPGISIAADTARLKLNLDYQPNLMLHAINGPLNVITQQLNAVGLLTVVPDFAYADVRAFTGVQSQLGALAGAGTIGAGNIGTGVGTGAATTAGPDLGATGQGLNRNNEVQTSSFGISPYLLRQFGDYGTGKIGVSATASRTSNITGFAASPFPTGGANGQSLLTTEEIAHYTSGEFLNKFQYAFDADVSQSHALNQGGDVTVGTTTIATQPTNFDSRRESFSNQLTYAVSHTFSLLGSIGYENIQYTGLAGANITGLTWNAGFTYTPGPDGTITITYGRQNGTDAFQASGFLAMGRRSMLTVSYSNTVGTQLENLQNQLNASAIGLAGNLINAQTGGPTLVANNALGVQSGVFRFNTFNTAITTQWDRDTFQGSLTWASQTSVDPAVGTPLLSVDANGNLVVTPTATTTTGPSTVISTATLYWTHLMTPDTTLNSSVAYSFTRRDAGLNDSTISTSVGLQYAASATTTLTARYSFFDRVSKIPGYSLYENLLLLGITKQF